MVPGKGGCCCCGSSDSFKPFLFFITFGLKIKKVLRLRRRQRKETYRGGKEWTHKLKAVTAAAAAAVGGCVHAGAARKGAGRGRGRQGDGVKMNCGTLN